MYLRPGFLPVAVAVATCLGAFGCVPTSGSRALSEAEVEEAEDLAPGGRQSLAVSLLQRSWRPSVVNPATRREEGQNATGNSTGNSTTNSSWIDGVTDDADQEIAEVATKDKDDGGAPLDGENETSKDLVKGSVEQAIANGVMKAKVKQEFEPPLEPEARSNESVKVVKESVKDALNRSIRQALRENNDSKESSSGAREGNADVRENISQSEGELDPKRHSAETDVRPERQNSNASGGGNKSSENGTEVVVDAISDKVAKAIDREASKAHNEGRDATKEELEEAASSELDRIWDILANAKRYKRYGKSGHGIAELFSSEGFFDWLLLLAAVVVSMLVHSQLVEWPSEVRFHGFALLIWFVLGAAYAGIIFARRGREDGVIWTNGYILEIVFLIENVFVFHIIVKAFNIQRRITQKILFIVVACQIVFQLVFYMGLAECLKGMNILPYILGPWLVYCGVQACIEDDDQPRDVMNIWAVRQLRTLLGSRLSTDVLDSESIVMWKGGKLVASMSGLCLLCVLCADFALEIDVTVTKIENLPDPYLCFSSSVMASFAVPELFFVARDLFRQFFGLKYAISFVLVFFGLQMLAHDFFTLSALTNMLVIVVALAAGVCFTGAMGLGSAREASSPSDSRAQKGMP